MKHLLSLLMRQIWLDGNKDDDVVVCASMWGVRLFAGWHTPPPPSVLVLVKSRCSFYFPGCALQFDSSLSF